MATKALQWPTCIHKESNFGTKSLFLPSIHMQILRNTWTTFPLELNRFSPWELHGPIILEVPIRLIAPLVFYSNINVPSYHCWIHKHEFRLCNINCRNIIKRIITKRENTSSKNYMPQRYLYLNFLRGYICDMLMNKKMTKNKISKKMVMDHGLLTPRVFQKD
jgi:hypothetical protein